MKQYILGSIILILGFYSCSEDKIKSYHGGQYLYFSQVMDKKADSIEVSFNNYPLDNEINVSLEVALVGNPLLQAEPYKISIVEDKTTALPENYKLPESTLFSPNVAKDKFDITLIKTENLTEDVTLCIKIEKNDFFEGSLKQYETIRVIFNNVESKPLWWDSEVQKVYLGTYSREKYRALVEYGGEEATDFGSLNSAKKRQLALRLKAAIEEHNLKEADGKNMTVPIY